MKTQWTRLLLAAPLALLAVSGCDDDGGGNAGDAAVDGPQMFDGGVDGPAVETGSGGTGGGSGGTDGGLAGGGGDTAPLNPACAPADPNVYPTAMFAANTTAENMIIDKLNTLDAKMKDAESDPNKPVTKQMLDALFNAGAGGLKDVTSAYYAAQIEGDMGFFAAFDSAIDNKAFVAGTSEGIYGSWAFNANGLDLHQQVDKGLMSAAQYKRMVDISRQTTVTPADIDRMLAIMGIEGTFPYDTANDKRVAKYASRRSARTDANNYYLDIKNSSIAARAAAANPTMCDAELSAALDRIRKAWEMALVTTTLYYVADASNKIAAASTDAQKAGALHSLGEAIAFTHGFKTLPTQDRIITDAQIDEILRVLFAVPDGTAITGAAMATPYKHLTDVAQSARLPEVITKIKAIYGLTDAQVESLKINHPRA